MHRFWALTGLEANDPPSSVYSIDSFDSPVDTFDRRYFWVWLCKGRFIEAGNDAWDEAGIEAGATVFDDKIRLIIYNKLYIIHNIISNYLLHIKMSHFAGQLGRVLTKFISLSPPPRHKKSGEVGWGKWVSERRGRELDLDARVQPSNSFFGQWAPYCWHFQHFYM